MDAAKKLYFPTYRWDGNGETPCTLAGATADGRVVLTAEGRALLEKAEIPHEEAHRLAWQLVIVSGRAKDFADEARGLNLWTAHPIGGGLYDVSHGGQTWRFRPIVNSPRRHSPGRRFREGHVCTACRREAPEKATMYVPVKPTKKNESCPFSGHRLCETCVRPELAAAVVGAAVIAEGKPDAAP